MMVDGILGVLDRADPRLFGAQSENFKYGFLFLTINFLTIL
jgi:hypothetical protein